MSAASPLSSAPSTLRFTWVPVTVVWAAAAAVATVGAALTAVTFTVKTVSASRSPPVPAALFTELPAA